MPGRFVIGYIVHVVISYCESHDFVFLYDCLQKNKKDFRRETGAAGDLRVFCATRHRGAKDKVVLYSNQMRGVSKNWFQATPLSLLKSRLFKPFNT